VQVIRTDIDGCFAAAPGLCPLPGILLYGQTSSVNLHYEVIRYAGARSDLNVTRKAFQNFLFTTGLQGYIPFIEYPNHAIQDIDLFIHGDVYKRKTGSFLRSPLYLGIEIHKTGNASPDAHFRRLVRYLNKIVEVVVYFPIDFIKADRIETPVDSSCIKMFANEG
jgi:hypothetical protein